MGHGKKVTLGNCSVERCWFHLSICLCFVVVAIVVVDFAKFWGSIDHLM